MSEELQPVFSIERLFVKDLSLEVPNAPQIFLEQGEPEVDMRVSTNSEKLEDGYYNVDVTVTVTALRRSLPEHPLPLRTRSHFHQRNPRRLPARTARSDQLRSHVPATTRRQRIIRVPCMSKGRLKNVSDDLFVWRMPITRCFVCPL